MSTTKAIIYTERGKVALQEVPRPRLRDEYIIVKVNAVALNPTDWRAVDNGNVAGIGRRTGCDYAGIVEEVGPKVTKSFKKGDRIAGFAAGNDTLEFENGAFAQYIAVKGDVQMNIPDNLSDEEAATLGVGVFTVGLYRVLGLPLPLPGPETSSIDQHVLIHGGSTASGNWGIQFAKASGLRVITTSSPQNFDYLKSLGAEKVFDYKDPSLGSHIRAYTGNSLKLAWDCAGSAEELMPSALSSDGGKYATIQFVNQDKIGEGYDKIDGPHFTMTYDVLGEKSLRGPNETPPKPQEFEFAKKFVEIARELLADGRIKVPRIGLNRGGSGLEGVIKGIDELRAGKVRGQKLVYTL